MATKNIFAPLNNLLLFPPQLHLPCMKLCASISVKAVGHVKGPDSGKLIGMDVENTFYAMDTLDPSSGWTPFGPANHSGRYLEIVPPLFGGGLELISWDEDEECMTWETLDPVNGDIGPRIPPHGCLDGVVGRTGYSAGILSEIFFDC